jgi:hypothetical protein
LIVNKKIYSSHIIKAGALLADTTTLFDNWDESQSVSTRKPGAATTRKHLRKSITIQN